MQIIEDDGGGRYTAYTQTMRLRWAVDQRSTLPPRLQQCWTAVDHEDGRPVRERDDWRDVETVWL